MARSVLPALGIATLIVLAGCHGIVGSPTPSNSVSPNASSSSASPFQELEGQHLWIGGTVDHVANTTLYLRNNGVVTPISLEDAASFRCRSTGSELSCDSVERREVQPGEEVCANVALENGTVQAIKVFTNAVCGGPQAPPQ